MPQISPAEYRALPLRANTFLAGVPLHDVWAVDLPRPRENVSLVGFQARGGLSIDRLPRPARALLDLRLFLGRVFSLETAPRGADAASFASRLTDEDRARSSVIPGTAEGLFRVVYRFENEQLLELQNRTAHAAAVSALVNTTAGYRYYFAVYVANSGWFTRVYMALIDPFRRWIIYPALLNGVRTTWMRSAAADTSN